VTRGIYAELRSIVNKKARMMLSSLGLLLHAADLRGVSEADMAGGGSRAVGGIAGPSRHTRGSVFDLTARQAPNSVQEPVVASPGFGDEAVSGRGVQELTRTNTIPYGTVASAAG